MVNRYYKVTEIRSPTSEVSDSVSTYYFNSNGAGQISLDILGVDQPLTLAVLEQITEEEFLKATEER